MKSNNKLTATALKEALWETLNQVKGKKIGPEVANSVAAQSREIMRIVKTEIQVFKLSGKKPSANLLGFSSYTQE